jgi:ABC-2 type transport system ATP-binding protein
MIEPVIKVENLVKHFGAVRAVDGISFEVMKGEIFGLLGPNGAGKTTTLETIEGLQKPTSGRTVVFGIDTNRQVAKVKERIGVQLQASAYFEQLTLKEILELFGRFYPRCVKPEELLDKVGLLEKARATVGTLSGGQKQRFTIAATLVNDPEVIFLDEPTTGLDPQVRRSVWDLIQQIHNEGRTVVLTTHYMEEAQSLCRRVAIIDMGKIVALDTPTKLIHSLPTPYKIKLVSNTPLSPEELGKLEAVKEVVVGGDGAYFLNSTDTGRSLPLLLSWVQQKSIALEHIEVITASLEDVFLALTGKKLRD